jgi:hypothetical protein
MDRFRHLPLIIFVIAVAATTSVALTSCDPTTSTTSSLDEVMPSVKHESASGQAAAAQLLTQAQTLPSGEEPWATLDLTTSDGSLVRAYAVAATKFFERGPNDDGYRVVDPKSEGFVAYSNWAGGGFCPAEFNYDVYDSDGTKVNVLTQVRYFLNGE